MTHQDKKPLQCQLPQIEFLEFVHDIDLNFLKEDRQLDEQIEKIKGKKIIFTNGSHASKFNFRFLFCHFHLHSEFSF